MRNVYSKPSKKSLRDELDKLTMDVVGYRDDNAMRIMVSCLDTKEMRKQLEANADQANVIVGGIDAIRKTVGQVDASTRDSRSLLGWFRNFMADVFPNVSEDCCDPS